MKGTKKLPAAMRTQPAAAGKGLRRFEPACAGRLTRVAEAGRCIAKFSGEDEAGWEKANAAAKRARRRIPMLGGVPRIDEGKRER